MVIFLNRVAAVAVAYGKDAFRLSNHERIQVADGGVYKINEQLEAKDTRSATACKTRRQRR